MHRLVPGHSPRLVEYFDSSSRGPPPAWPESLSLNRCCCTAGPRRVAGLIEVLADMHGFDPAIMAWIDFSGGVSGAPPPPRFTFGFATAGEKLYAHAGYAGDGGSDGMRGCWWIVGWACGLSDGRLCWSCTTTGKGQGDASSWHARLVEALMWCARVRVRGR